MRGKPIYWGIILALTVWGAGCMVFLIPYPALAALDYKGIGQWNYKDIIKRNLRLVLCNSLFGILKTILLFDRQISHSNTILIKNCYASLVKKFFQLRQVIK